MKCKDFMCYRGEANWCEECTPEQQKECVADSHDSEAVVIDNPITGATNEET